MLFLIKFARAKNIFIFFYFFKSYVILAANVKISTFCSFFCHSFYLKYNKKILSLQSETLTFSQKGYIIYPKQFC